MASRAARAAARRKKLSETEKKKADTKTVTDTEKKPTDTETLDIEYVGESCQQKDELTIAGSSEISPSENINQSPIKKGGSQKQKKINIKESPKKQNLPRRTRGQNDDDDDVCSIEEIDGEHELLEKDSKQRVLKDIMEMEGQNEAEDEITLLSDEEQELIPSNKSTDPNKDTDDDDELEVVWSTQVKDIVPLTIDDNDNKGNNLTKEEPEIITCEEDSQDIEMNNDDDDDERILIVPITKADDSEVSQEVEVENVDDERSCEENSQESTFKSKDDTESGRPWASSAKEWVAKPVRVEIHHENSSLESMQLRAEDVQQKDIALNDNIVENVSPNPNNESVSNANIDDELDLNQLEEDSLMETPNQQEEDLLLETTTVVGTDINTDDTHNEKSNDQDMTENNEESNDSNDEDWFDIIDSEINENSKSIVLDDIPNVKKQLGLYYPDHFQYRVENFNGMCEDEFHRVIVADDGIFAPKPNNRFAITLLTVNKGGLDFVGIALRETLKNLVIDKPEKLILIRFVCGLCNIVNKYKYNKSNGTNIPCCGDCCLWSVRGDYEKFYEDYNKLWQSVQSEFPEAVFIPTALPSINVKNISIFNQHEYCCPHLPTHFPMSGQLVDNMQILFDKSIKYINPALNNLCFEMGFQRVYWNKEKNRSRWTALMKAVQSDCFVARNLQIDNKFAPGDSQGSIDPETIVDIDNEAVNQEAMETDTNLSTGTSSDNLLSSSTPSYGERTSSAADNSKASTQGDFLAEDMVVDRGQNENLDQEREDLGQTEDTTNDQDINRSSTGVPDQGLDEARPRSPKRSWRNSSSTGNNNETTEKRRSSSPHRPSKKLHLSDKNTESRERKGDQDRASSPIRFPPSDDRGKSPMAANTQVTGRPGDWSCPVTSCSKNNFVWRRTCYRCNEPKPGGEGGSGGGSILGHYKGNNLSWKHNQSYNKPWHNNPMWGNQNRNYNNYNNNRSWSNNRPWNNQWNKSSSWRNHSYNQYKSHWNSNQNQKKWDDSRKMRNFNAGEEPKQESLPSSSTDRLQNEVKDNSKGENSASASTLHSTPVPQSEKQQQNLPSTSHQSNSIPLAGPSTSHQNVSKSHLQVNSRIKEEQGTGSFQRIVRIKREPGNVEYWPEDAPMYTIKRGPIDDYRPLKDELKDEQSV